LRLCGEKKTENQKMSELKGMKNYRIEKGITRGKEIEITVDGGAVRTFEGETIAAALTAAGIREIRRAPQHSDPRGLYCCMGSCHGCLVTVNGQPNVRACVTSVEAGQKVELQDGLGHVDMDTPGPAPGRLVRQEVSLVVIGGGPAGLSAAIAAARAGTSVLVIDENLQAGGQIYRQLPESYHVNDSAFLGVDYADGQALLQQVQDLSDRIAIWNDALVWSVFESKQPAEARELAVARGDDLVLLQAGAIVVATGAYERPVPVPGWTLPGVMTAGGAQVLLKSQRVFPGQRVLLAGTGPLQLVVGNQMLDAGMEVVAVADCASNFNAWRFLPDLVRRPDLIKQGLDYLFRLKRSGVQMLRSHVLQAVEGDTQADRAVLGKVDSTGRPVGSDKKTFDIDTVCIGYGLIPSVWLTSMLNCTHTYNPLVGGWIPAYNENMQTDQPGVFVAGDGAGIAGVLAARSEGKIAGLYAAAHNGNLPIAQVEQEARPERKNLATLGKFRRALDHMYRIHPDLYANISDDTIVCRCEGVPAGEIRKAIREGTPALNDIKKRTRCGMGYCQGTNCTPTIAAMLAREFGVEPETITMMTTRPPARPIPLSLLLAK
jgi:thioredoxin reductase/bacterioferritin-associated ferredoxin